MEHMSDFIIIVDLEATCCDRGGVTREEMEIIEIGAVAAEVSTGKVVSEFQSFVRPVRHPVLTPFCRKLTTIEQAEVDAADIYPTPVDRFRHWLSAWSESDFGSWGDYDRRQFEQDCAFHDVEFPFNGAHRNVKKEAAKRMKLRKPLGVGVVLSKLGMEFEGTAHRGIDDVRNIARICARVLCS